MHKICTLLLLAFLVSSCWGWHGGDDDYLYTSQFEPVTISRTDFENSIILEAPKPIQNAGKIYVKDDFLFINEKEAGVHIFDNSDVTAPVAVAYIPIHGNTDIAVKNNTIYAHHLTDLIAFQYIAHSNSLRFKSRLQDVFPGLVSPDGFEALYYNIPTDQVLVGYRPL